MSVIPLQGWTSLHCAIFWGCAQTARALLALGADADLVFPEHDNDDGWPQARSPTAFAH
jgi:ankyrin repeat protein